MFFWSRRVYHYPHPVPEILQGGHDMEDPSPFERIAASGSDDDPEPVRDGIGVDGEWEHQYVCEVAS